MIEWLHQKDFWQRFYAEYKPNDRYLNEVAYIYCGLEEIANIATTDPVDTPNDEQDFPGPVLRWYASIQGHLVLVTYHMHEEPFVLDFEDDEDFIVLDVVQKTIADLGLKISST